MFCPKAVNYVLTKLNFLCHDHIQIHNSTSQSEIKPNAFIKDKLEEG